MLVESGYLGLSMDAIAGSLSYSKGTIYNHFPCKEEIIIALALQTMKKRFQLFQDAAQFLQGGEHLLRIGDRHPEIIVRVDQQQRNSSHQAERHRDERTDPERESEKQTCADRAGQDDQGKVETTGRRQHGGGNDARLARNGLL